MGGGQPRERMSHRRHLRGVSRRHAPYLGIAAALLVLGLVTTIVGLTNADSGDALWVGMIAVAAAPLILLPVALELWLRPRAAEATPTGLFWRDGRGDRSRPWGEVSEVYRHDILNANNARGQTAVTFSDGDTVRFDQSLTDYEQLADRVQAGSAEAMMTAARASLAGGELAFGPVTLRTDGVAVGKGFHLWGEIADYTLFLGSFLLFVHAGGKIQQSEAVVLHEMPNYAVLLGLLRERGIPFNPNRMRTA